MESELLDADEQRVLDRKEVLAEIEAMAIRPCRFNKVPKQNSPNISTPGVLAQSYASAFRAM